MSLTDWEKDKVLVALKKWVDTEPMSKTDLERVIWVIDNCPLQVEMLDNATAAGLQIRLRSIISQRFLPQQQPQQGK